MHKRIKVERIEFDKAENEGFVYGKDLERQRYNSTYIDLGHEKPYVLGYNDDLRTDYRVFLSCNVQYAETDQKADQEIFYESIFGVTVIIYC
jgi:hypothetical protein